jgi:hypothetical protein
MFKNKVVIGKQGEGLRDKDFPLFLSPLSCPFAQLCFDFVRSLFNIAQVYLCVT